jgi:octaprenyl-diphosphate synthase
VDDALDYSGESDALGKNPGDDFREGKATLPLLLAIARTGAAEKGFWDRTAGRLEQEEGDFQRARHLIAASGADAATLKLAGDYAVSAKAQLADFATSNSWRPALEDLADFAVSRRA